MRSNIKKFLCLIIAIITMFNSSIFAFAEEKQYYTGTIDDFDDDEKIIVYILHEYSGLDKEWFPEDFPEVEIEKLEYISDFLDANKEYPMTNFTKFHQILLITISNKGKENVLEAIHSLEKNPVVLSAFPVEYIIIDDNDTILMGDANGDEHVDATDALLILKHAAKLETISEEYIELCDMDFNGIIDASDALSVLKHAAMIL